MLERVQVTDVAQIYKLWNAYAAALNRVDLETLVSMWAEGGLQLPPDGPPRVGRRAIWKGIHYLFDHFKPSHMDFQTEEVRVLGHWAYAHGTYQVDLTSRVSGETRNITGKFLDILVKQIDGSWKIAIDCHNYKQPGGLV
jgi:uncharacterized protein (TIGR02246 family)